MTEFLALGKADKYGEFKRKMKSQGKVHADPKSTPNFWKKISEFVSNSNLSHCVLIHVNFDDNENGMKHFGADLYISSDDLNFSYFHKSLAKILLLEKSVISIDITRLLKRGHERFLSLVKDFRRLFDSRVFVIIFDKEHPTTDLDELVDLKIGPNSVLPSPTKMVQTLGCSQKSRVEQAESNIHITTGTFYGNDLRHKGFILKEHSKLDSVHEDVKDAELKEKVNLMNKLIEKVKKENDELLKLHEDDKVTCDELVKENSQLAVELNSQIIDNQENKSMIDSLRESIGRLESEVVIERQLKERLEIELEQRSNTASEQWNDESLVRLHNNQDILSSHISVGKQTEGQPCPKRSPQKLSMTSLELKDKLNEIVQKYPNAGPAEVLHRCCKFLVYDAEFIDGGTNESDRFTCKLRIRNFEFISSYDKIWEGRGKSKYMAKQNAFSLLISFLTSE